MIRNIREAQQNEEGFTLIELLVVVIIIGILAAIAIPAFLNQRERAWQAELTSSVRNVALDVEAEATAFGGDYTSVTNGAATGIEEFIQQSLTDLQNDPATPVVYAEANTASSSTGFAFCMEHSQLTDGTNRNASVTYNSTTGGLGDFSTAACTGAPTLS